MKLTLLAGLCLLTSASGAVWANGPKTDEVTVSASEGPLHMRVRGRIVLGRDASAEITLTRPEGTDPVLQANIGQVSQPAEVEGRLVANYTPPKELFPQVAIIAGVDKDGRLLDWVAIPLYGETVVHTATEPRASVVVRIGDSRFGPVKANRRGHARVGIIAPPGVTSGTTISKDRLGNVKEATFNLDVPGFNRVLSLCPSTGDRLLVLAVDPSGKPKRGESLDLAASKGTLAPPTLLASGLYQSFLTLPPDARIGESVELSAAVPGDEVSRSGCTLKLRRGLAARVILKADPTVYVAGSSKPVSVSVEFLAANGRTALPVPLEVAADIGQVSDVQATPDGSHRVSWKLPDEFAGKERAQLSVRTLTADGISDEVSVELRPGPLSRLDISVQQKQLRADGQSTTSLFAEGHDAGGNPVTSVNLVAQAEGQISAFARSEAGGRYQAIYTAPRSFKELEDKIIVRSSEAREVKATVQIHLLPEQIMLTLCPKVGYATNLGRISSALFALQFAVRLPVLDKRVSVGVETMFYWSDRTERLINMQEEARIELWAVPVHVRGTYRIPMGSLAVFGGLSGGVLIVGRNISSPTDAPIETLEAHPELSAHLGADVSVGPGRLAFEMSYMQVFSRAGPVQADLSVPLVTGGYQIEF